MSPLHLRLKKPVVKPMVTIKPKVKLVVKMWLQCIHDVSVVVTLLRMMEGGRRERERERVRGGARDG
jgi:hypothetical protein